MTLLLISPSPFLLEEVEAEIATRMPILKVIGKCYTLQEGIRAAEVLKPDVVLLDGEIGNWVAIPKYFNKVKGFMLLVLSTDVETRQLWSKTGAIVLAKPFEAEVLLRLLLDR